MRVYLVHWMAEELPALVEPLQALGHEVAIQHSDGSDSWQRLRQDPPDAMLISMRRLPSHGRRVASVRLEVKWLREIPLAFFDASSEEDRKNRATFADAANLSWAQVPAWLQGLTPGAGERARAAQKPRAGKAGPARPR